MGRGVTGIEGRCGRRESLQDHITCKCGGEHNYVAGICLDGLHILLRQTKLEGVVQMILTSCVYLVQIEPISLLFRHFLCV